MSVPKPKARACCVGQQDNGPRLALYSFTWSASAPTALANPTLIIAHPYCRLRPFFVPEQAAAIRDDQAPTVKGIVKLKGIQKDRSPVRSACFLSFE